MGKGWPDGDSQRVNYSVKNPSRVRGTCIYCLENEATTLDHTTPKMLGGSRGLNLVFSCEVCNTRKGLLFPLEFVFAKDGWHHLWLLTELRQAAKRLRHAKEAVRKIRKSIRERALYKRKDVI